MVSAGIVSFADAHRVVSEVHIAVVAFGLLVELARSVRGAGIARAEAENLQKSKAKLARVASGRRGKLIFRHLRRGLSGTWL